MMNCLRGAVAALLCASAATAQQPSGTPSTPDDNRVPVYGPNSTSGAGVGNIPSFPSQQQGPVGPVQQYLPPRPQLSPYLNLFRGNVGSGFGAIDYYNFVRPGQQATGSYVGRQLGQSPMVGGRTSVGFTYDQQVDLQTSNRPAGTPTYFMNTGGYFNRLGTIGQAGRPGAAPTQAPTTGRR